MLRSFVLVILFSLGFSSFAYSEKPQEKDLGYDLADAQAIFKGLIRADTGYDKYMKMALKMYTRNISASGILNQETLATLVAQDTARERALQLMKFLVADIDNDGQVTFEELKKHYQSDNKHNTNYHPILLKARSADQNDDKVLTFDEMRHAQQEVTPDKASHKPYTRVARMRALLALDPNKDGQLELEEIEEIARAVFDSLDQNHDSVVSDLELRGYMCTLPKADVNETIVVFGAYEGGALSSISTVGQDKETTAASVLVEKGDKPLYLVLTSYKPMVWSIVGDVERITKLTLNSTVAQKTSGVGVVGIKKNKVHFQKSQECFKNFYAPNSVNAIRAKGLITNALGRAPDVMLGSYNVLNVSLPSGTEIKDAKMKPKTELDRLVQLQYQGGVRELEIKDIISDSELEEYEIYPEIMGISQLIKQGKLEPMSDRRSYKIIKPITRFPAGLAGGNSVTFVLAKGVPLPKGKAGHSCVLSEETGETLLNARLCRR